MSIQDVGTDRSPRVQGWLSLSPKVGCRFCRDASPHPPCHTSLRFLAQHTRALPRAPQTCGTVACLPPRGAERRPLKVVHGDTADVLRWGPRGSHKGPTRGRQSVRAGGSARGAGQREAGRCQAVQGPPGAGRGRARTLPQSLPWEPALPTPWLWPHCGLLTSGL